MSTASTTAMLHHAGRAKVAARCGHSQLAFWPPRPLRISLAALCMTRLRCSGSLTRAKSLRAV